MTKVLTMILAGGRGDRLEPLTMHRAKPAVPFGGIYRIIDFTLSNCINSQLRKITLLTQYKSASLARHIEDGWSFLSHQMGEYIEVIPPQKRVGEDWYKGTADAIYQNFYTIEKENPEHVLILAGDHIYKMDYLKMLRFHEEKEASITVGAIEVKKEESTQFGVLEVDKHQRVVSFHEKPQEPMPLPWKCDACMASMGIYVFRTDVLYSVLSDDAMKNGFHDFGRDVLPSVFHDESLYAYEFVDENKKHTQYWRDVGTIDSFYEANMDLIAIEPQLNLYDPQWPIFTFQPQSPPAKFIFAENHSGGRRGVALNSMVSQGCIISGGKVVNSILSPWVRVEEHAVVEDSVVFHGVRVDKGARVKRAILDKDVHIPEGTTIGYDREHDSRRGLFISPSGIVVVPKGMVLS